MLMKRMLLIWAMVLTIAFSMAQQPGNPPPGGGNPAGGARNFPGANGARQEPKPYKEVITDKAVSHTGLFTVHKVDDKWYFELPDSILTRDILVVTRYGKTPAGGNYGGEQVNQQMIRWEKGPSNTIFLRVVTVVNMSSDSTGPISRAVSNSNVNPIASAFDVKAYGKDSVTNTRSTVIEVTDFFKGDNQVVSLTPGAKRRYKLAPLSADRSYIESIHTYPINTEIRSVKTFTSSPAGGFGAPGGPAPAASLPAADAAGAVTLELNNSFILLPKTPLRK